MDSADKKNKKLKQPTKEDYVPHVTFLALKDCFSFMPSNSHYIPARG